MGESILFRVSALGVNSFRKNLERKIREGKMDEPDYAKKAYFVGLF